MANDALSPQPLRGAAGASDTEWFPHADREYEIEPCGCGWAPELGTHYRVVLVT